MLAKIEEQGFMDIGLVEIESRIHLATLEASLPDQVILEDFTPTLLNMNDAGLRFDIIDIKVAHATRGGRSVCFYGSAQECEVMR